MQNLLQHNLEKANKNSMEFQDSQWFSIKVYYQTFELFS